MLNENAESIVFVLFQAFVLALSRSVSSCIEASPSKKLLTYRQHAPMSGATSDRTKSLKDIFLFRLYAL